MTVADASAVRRVVGEVDFEYGCEYLDEHDAGLHLPQAGSDALLRAVSEVKANPAWTLLLEGHCRGLPDEIDDIRGSIAEEAADFCKEKLVEAGVENEILCRGSGCAEGRGMRVSMCLLEPPPAAERTPEERRRGADVLWGNVLGDVAGHAVEAATVDTPQPPVEVFEFKVPDVTGLSDAEQLAVLEEELMRAVPHGIKFEGHRASIHENDMPMVRGIAGLLKAFPRLGVQCAGHTHGQPKGNNLAKRVLAQERAVALRDALAEEGAPNAMACVGFGSALARGGCVRLHGLLPGEAESEDATLRILGWNTAGLTLEQEVASLDQLLSEALEQGLDFQPNKASISKSAAGVVRRLSWILQAFPNWVIVCEGHTKGRPEEDSESKQRLSQVRAERLAAALHKLGVQNRIECFGLGCSQGLGMCVRMRAREPECEFDIPDTEGFSQEELLRALDDLLSKILQEGIAFEPNSHDVPPSNLRLIRAIARALKAFPDAIILIEGHTKGKPEENSDMKRKLSQARAEAVRTAVRMEGAGNEMVCVGQGSAAGMGACLRMRVVDASALESNEATIPDISGMSREEQEALLNRLLAEALEGTLEFEPNSDVVPISDMQTVRSLARILKAFPTTFSLKCEGHTKGTPETNSAARIKLSHLRAEAVKTAVIAEGVTHSIRVVGRGSEEGVGMQVRMFVFDPSALQEHQVTIPEAEPTMSREERRLLLNDLLAKALKRKIAFEPNSVNIEVSVSDTVGEIARVLKAFPEFAVVCEGHAKGAPETNNVSKVRLSKARAESVRAALVQEGVDTDIVCKGRGSVEGCGMCVHIFAPEEDAASLQAAAQT